MSTDLLAYLGFVNPVVFTLSLTYLYQKEDQFSLSNHAFSQLYTFKSTKNLFIVAVTSFSLIQLIIAINASLKLMDNYKQEALILFLLGSVFLALTALLSINSFPNTHAFTFLAALILVGTGMILLAFEITNNNSLAGSILIFTTALTIPLTALIPLTKAAWGEIGL